MKGQTEEFRDQNIHCFYRDGNGPLLLFLHGYPNSSHDWRQVIDLEHDHAILTFDFLGFGLSSKPVDHDYSLKWQADLAEELVSRFSPGRQIFIIAHDMGTSVATELFARDIENQLKINVIGSLLFNGNMDMRRSSLILGQKLLRSRFGGFCSRLSTSWIFRWQLGTVFGKKCKMSQEEGETQWALMTHNNGHLINHKLIQYTFERERLRDRWLGAISNWTKPIFFAWGMKDPVATTFQLNGLKELRPQAEVSEFDELGHFPQIEHPETFVLALKSILVKMQG